MKVAALDLGTNSFLCLVAEVENGQIRQVLSDQVEIVRLGQDVNKTKHFHPEALVRARSCLEKFRQTIDSQKPEKILAMATSAARDVTNADELFRIGRDLQIPIEIIPGSQEAEITFMGSTSGLPRDNKIRAVIDIGGGSTEIIAGSRDSILGGRSLNVGAVRLTEMFFRRQPPTIDELQEFENHLNPQISQLVQELKNLQIQELIAVAGTPTELVAATIGGFDSSRIDGYQLTNQRLDEWVQKLKASGTAERMQNFGISKGRADVILAGTMILSHSLKAFGFSSLTVSTRGVRYGVALELEKRSRKAQA